MTMKTRPPAMTPQGSFESLGNSPLFQGISLDEFMDMMAAWNGAVRDYDPRSTIRHPTDTDNRLTVLVAGRAQTVQENFVGARTIMKESVPGDILGLFSTRMISDSLPFIIAGNNGASVLSFDMTPMQTPCPDPPHFHMQMLVNLSRVLIIGHMRMYDHLVNISQRTTREKLMSYLSGKAARTKGDTFEIDLSRQELADFLCVDRSAMCTELSHMRAAGILDYRGNTFMFKNTVPEG